MSPLLRGREGGYSSGALVLCGWGAAAAIALAGAILAVSAHWSQLTQARTYALLVGAIGLANIVWALVSADRSAGTRADRLTLIAPARTRGGVGGLVEPERFAVTQRAGHRPLQRNDRGRVDVAFERDWRRASRTSGSAEVTPPGSPGTSAAGR